jgi:hypothetical protein
MSVTQQTSPTVSQFTIGNYPASLKRELREKLPLFGAQRLTSLSYACVAPIAATQA